MANLLYRLYILFSTFLVVQYWALSLALKGEKFLLEIFHKIPHFSNHVHGALGQSWNDFVHFLFQIVDKCILRRQTTIFFTHHEEEWKYSNFWKSDKIILAAMFYNFVNFLRKILQIFEKNRGCLWHEIDHWWAVFDNFITFSMQHKWYFTQKSRKNCIFKILLDFTLFWLLQFWWFLQLSFLVLWLSWHFQLSEP